MPAASNSETGAGCLGDDTPPVARAAALQADALRRQTPSARPVAANKRRRTPLRASPVTGAANGPEVNPDPPEAPLASAGGGGTVENCDRSARERGVG